MFPTSTRTLLLLFLLLSAAVLWAQPTDPILQNPFEKVSVTGTLLQESTGEPLAFATVVLYALADSSMAANTLTEVDGKFRLEVTPGSYYLVFSYVGFEEKTIADLQISGEFASVDLEEVYMRADAIALQEVEVRAERSQMELKLDRRVFNVGKDLANAGNSAADILDRVPSVSVDPEGNVSLRGSQSVRILVNGKPSGLLSAGDSEALLRMQGDIIESVEVITNPSARYEAEGEAGIINIILKKNQEKGVNGSFGATVGHPHNYGGSYNLNFRRQDLNFFSNFGVDYRKSPGGGEETQQFFENGQLTDFFTSETDQERGGIGGYLQGGLDWNLDDRSTLTGSILYRLGDDDNAATVTYRDFDANGNVLATTVRDTEEGEEDHNLEAAMLYKRTFDTPDREWTVSFNYNLNDDTEIADYVQTSTDPAANFIERSSNTEDETNLLFQTDYIHPLGESSKLEGGLRAALRTVTNDFLVERQGDDGEFAPLDGLDDKLRYTENIYAAYLIGAHEFGPLGIQAGLRAELSDIRAALETIEPNDQNYLNLFPSVSLSYKFSEQNQLQMSYSRRLSRPYFRRLLPFSNFNNPRNNRVGNPNLRPEYTDSYEMGFLRYLRSGSLLTSAYYRRTTGVIETLALPVGDGTVIGFPVNLSTRNSFGIELSFSYDLTPWWTLNSDLNAFRAMVDGEYEGVDYSSDTYTWTGGLNSKVDIGKSFQLQASFDYNGPQNTTQGRRLSSSSFDLAASLDAFAGKGTFTLAGRDLFNDRRRRLIVDLPDYQSESVFQWRQTRQVVLTFNYRLNQEKRPGNGRRGEGGGGDGF